LDDGSLLYSVFGDIVVYSYVTNVAERASTMILKSTRIVSFMSPISISMNSNSYIITLKDQHLSMNMAKNWRDTLFVWDGILSWIEKEEKKDDDDGDGCDGKDSKAVVGNTNDVQWNGTWVGSDSADASKVPTPKRGAFDEYVSSEHSFKVEGVTIIGKPSETEEASDAKDGSHQIGGDTSSLHRVAMIGGDGYDLGEGSDKKQHKDDRHHGPCTG
jgi:hypothetical protein